MCGNHGRGTEEVDGAGSGVVGDGVTVASALEDFPDGRVAPQRPGRRKPGHSLARAAPLPVP